MASRAIGKLFGIGHLRPLHRLTLPKYYSSLYTPDYLETGKSKIPLHVTLNVQLKGYDYPVLESYQKFIDKLTDNMDIDVEDSWAFPPKVLKIQRFKPNSSAVASEYDLLQYQRNIQITDLSATQYPILLRALEASLPMGVTLSVEYYNPTIEQKRYVPDTELLILKEELEGIKRK